MSICPICNEELKEEPESQGLKNYYNCPRCGIFGIPHLTDLSKIDITTKILISSYLYFFNKDESVLDTKLITKDFIEQLKKKEFSYTY